MIISILSYLISLYIWLLILYALLSWMPRIANSGFGIAVRRLVEPYLRLFDKIPTRFGMFDFKVLFGVVVLTIVQQLLWRL